MDLYLVRHAIAEEHHPVRWPDDSERTLTPKGIARFRRAARGLQSLVPEVDVMLSSPYPRAWQTAELLHREAGWPAPQHCPELEAVRSPTGVLHVLEAHRAHSSAAFVGHEPFLSRLASLLLCGDEGTLALELKKGGVALLDLAARPGPGGAVLRWSVSPRILRSLDCS
jgi:phosphohistidine phosphatase